MKKTRLRNAEIWQAFGNERSAVHLEFGSAVFTESDVAEVEFDRSVASSHQGKYSTAVNVIII